MSKPDQYPDHWPLGCSNAKRWINCPGSKLVGDVDVPSIEARIGTLGHKVAECILRGKTLVLSDDDRALLDREMSPEQRGFLKKAIRVCIAHTEKATEGAHFVFHETKIKSKRIPNHGGTCDVLAFWPERKELHVIDFKFGQEPVDAEENDQLAAYLNLGRQAFPDAERFYGTIVQPAYRGAECVEYAKEWLDEWMIRAAVAADPENMKRNADPTYCSYCPLLPTCEEAAKLGTQAAKSFDPILQEALAGETPTPELMDQVERIHMVNKMVGKALDATSTLLKTWHNNGDQLGHHKVTNTTRRSWDEEHDYSQLAKDYPDLFVLLPKGSPATIQKALGLSKKEFDELFSSMVTCSTTQVLRAGTKPDASLLDQFD